MPLYDYECDKCKTVREFYMDVNSVTIPVCETCGNYMIRLISKTNFKLLGDGWYKDGYSSKKEKENNV